MKQITLIKTSRYPDIAHLYEHMWARALTIAMDDYGLLNVVDYALDARTYRGGFIYIHLSLYTPQALRFLAHIEQVTPEFTDDMINGAALQVIAERQAEATWDEDSLRKQLRTLQAQPWQPLDNLTQFNSYGQRRSWRHFQLQEVSPRRFRDLSFTLTLEPAYAKRQVANSVPLFHWIALVIMRNADATLEDSSWYFKYDESVTDHAHKKGVSRTHHFRAHRRYTADFNDSVSDCRDYIQQLLKQAVVSKIAESLKQTSYDHPAQGPDELFIYEASGVLVGGKGWRSFADNERIREVLEHTSVHFESGRRKRTFQLRDFLAS